MEDELLSLIRQRDKQIATLKHEINNLINELKIKSEHKKLTTDALLHP